MSDQFDKKLSNKIRDTFDELEVPFEEKDWAALKVSMNQKNSGLLVLWKNPAMKVAAGILLIFGAFLAWNYTGLNNGINQHLADEQIQDQELIAQNEADNVSKNKADTKSPGNQNEESTNGTKEKNDIQPVIANRETGSRQNNSNANESSVLTSGQQRSMGTTLDPAIVPEADLIGEYGSLAYYGDGLEIVKEVSHRPVIEGDQIYITEDGIKEKPGVEISAATLVNYSNAEENAPLGFSGGVGSEIRISSRLSLHSGVFISSQQLKVGDSNVEVSFQSESGATDLDTFANLWAIDIPVNMRFYLNEKKSGGSYLSVGFSSLTYLSEKYTNKSTSLSVEVEEAADGSVKVIRAIDESVNTTKESPFSTFDLARMLNISMGFQYDIGRDLFLTVEPYIKYPLGPLTSENILFGSGGVNVQIRF